MQRVRQLFMISFLILSSFEAAHAASYYVDSTSGADPNSGTSSATPWKSLNKVNSTTFQAGDTINFKRGSVWTGMLEVKHSAMSGNPITYQAYGTGAAPQIKNPGVRWARGIYVTGDWNVVQDFLVTDMHESAIWIATGANRNTIRNNEMRASGRGAAVLGQFNLLTQNYVHDLRMIVNDASPFNDYGAVCFWIEAPNNVVSYNRGINCRAPSIDFGHDGGFIEVFNQGDNTYVHHNYVENTNGFFELGASASGSARNVQVAYNYIYNAQGSPGVCMNTGAYDITVTNFRFEHNTYVSTSGNPATYRVFSCRTDLSMLVVRNNIFYSDIQIANNGYFTHTNNLYHIVNMVNGSGVGYALGSGEKTGDPLFVNVGARDLHLGAGSPAIDAGINLGYSQDYEGKTVPVGSAPDMGAYEYGGATPTLLPPQNLRVSD
jgi:hypothetical protein